jgi:hypothetical protein
VTHARLTVSIAGAALLTWLAFAGDASAKARGPVFSLSIGYNGLPPSAETELTPLRYADDDAVAFHQFARTFTRRSFLLAILDAETQARFPALASEVRPPSRADLEKVLAEIEGGVDAAMAAGEEPSVLIFYSGHGGRAENGQAALTLSDGLLTKDALYANVLAPLRTVFVHLFVDACNAEAVVRPRDAQAQVVDPTAADVSVAFQKATLAGFPRVGALVASTAGAQAHEWDVYQSGIFTHEVLSALRGAADVDGNHRIEYSEIAAFLSAANRDVSDPRARPHMVVHPPPLDRRAPIVDLDEVRGAAFLDGRPAQIGGFFIEDTRGSRLLDLRAEAPFRVSLAVPADETLYLRNHAGQATVRLARGEHLSFDKVHLAENDVRGRGALESALRRGLFATGFGRGYYRGFVDSQEELVPLTVGDEDVVLVAPQPAAEPAGMSPRRRASWIAYGTAGALAVTAAVFGGLAIDARRDFENTYLEMPAIDASDRYKRDLTLSITTLVGAVVSAGIGTYLRTHDR